MKLKICLLALASSTVTAQQVISSRWLDENRKFKKLRRQLQRIDLCVKLSLLRLFHVGHVVQNRRSALSLTLHESFS